MKFLQRSITLLATLFCLTVVPLASVSAANLLDPTGKLCGNGSGNTENTTGAAACDPKANTNDNPLTGCPNNCGSGALYKAIDIISYIAGSAAIIVMIIGALRFATSGSDLSTNSRTDTDIENARRAIGGAAIGLVIIILAKYLIEFVISKI